MIRKRNITLIPQNARRAFVLLEVVVSLTLLGLALAAVMRSFTLSLASARQNEIVTTAGFLAQRMLDEYEVIPPDTDSAEGDFGEAYPHYYWRIDIEEERLKYRGSMGGSAGRDLESLRIMTLEILYNDGRYRSFRPVHLVTALSGLERFSYESLQDNQLFRESER